ncbi:MAG: Holliday junction branch migration protein RuvA [Alphaproteobacteria bacterium]|nr:Holliday junction branch migration protein RuvA [Alphaproteobacteria bacterium]
MIGSLSGLVDGIFDGYIILDVGGVGYRVFCSSKTVSKLSGVGQAAKLLIETQVREDHIHLFGFADSTEKQAFELITTVQGVGAKVALAILSALSANDLQMAIMTGDAKAITRANGVGPKLASRIVAELKGKTGSLGTNETMVVLQNAGSSGGPSNGAMDEALSALINLGYGKSEAGMTVASIVRQNPDIKTAELIRLSLKEIGKGAF